MAAPHAARLDAAEAAYVAALDAFNEAASAYAAEEARRISMKLRNRVVTWSCGMGTSVLEIARRRPVRRGSNYERDLFVIGSAHQSMGTTRPAFMDHLDRLEDEHRIPGIGAGVYSFRDGVEVTR